jgi:tetratricopeptide (TPR) repeat protein/glycosyltransferase involved in cell wall biosynthesis
MTEPDVIPEVSVALTLALNHYQTGQLDRARQICHQVLQQQPNQVAALHLLGLIAAQQQQIDEAIDRYRQVLALQPQHLEARNNLGIVLMAQGQVDEAIVHYQHALALQPDIAEIRVNLGNALQEKAAYAEAIVHYRHALTRQPNLAAAHKNLAHVLRTQGKVAEAMPHHQQAIALKPNDPEAHFGFAFTCLIAGDLSQGFAEYEWRWQLPYNPPRQLPSPAWDGSPLAGKTLLLYAEQGLGDTLQFVRYVPQLAQQGRVIVECQPALVRLLQTVPGIAAIVCQGEALPPFDVHAPLLSLPHLLGTTLDTIPATVPYLQSLETKRLEVPPQTRFKVGIAWAGDPKNPINRRRSCPLSQFLRLLEIPGVTLYSLQKGTAAEGAQIEHPHFVDLSQQLQDFADTAAIVKQLDLVISIDTALAHLAGALAHPVWVILPFAPDWRWLLHRRDSPWYPTMQLFRQPHPGDWSAVLAEVAAAVRSIEAIESQTLPAPVLPNVPQALGVGWQINPTLGWGVYGLNLTLQLLRHADWQPVLLLPPVMRAIANPLHRWQLQALLAAQRHMHPFDRRLNRQLCFPVLYALSSDFTTTQEMQAIDSPQKIGVVFFENTELSPVAVDRAKRYDLIVAGSSWNAQILKRYGIESVAMVPQGIDPTVFHPAPRSTLLKDRFVIFSGGKLEYRKGQDIVIAAFRQFRDRHPEALLMVAWHNYWTQFMNGLDRAGHVIGLPSVGAQGQLHLTDWLAKNGIPPEAVMDLGLTSNAAMGQILQAADVAVFPNRAEGGTNLVAMEALACGIPTILSVNTGHLDLINDLINDEICYPLRQQHPVAPTAQFPGVAGWGESEVDEVIERLEQVYGDRSSAARKGIAAAQFMQDWTWEKQTQRLLNAIC